MIGEGLDMIPSCSNGRIMESHVVVADRVVRGRYLTEREGGSAVVRTIGKLSVVLRD